MGKSKKGGGVRIKQMGPKMPAFSAEDLSMMMTQGGNAANAEQQHLQLQQELLQYISPTIDRNYKVIWPLRESFTMKFDTFRMIYPNYIDGNVNRVHGRKIAKAKSVIHDGNAPPTVSDISCVLQDLRIRHVIEGYKGYSRDARCHFEHIGRIRYDPNFDDNCIIEECMMNTGTTADVVSNSLRKQRLLEVIASRLPLVPSRIQRLEQERNERMRKEQERAALVVSSTNNHNNKTTKSTGQSSSTSTTTTTTTNNKKKAKTGKRK